MFFSQVAFENSKLWDVGPQVGTDQPGRTRFTAGRSALCPPCAAAMSQHADSIWHAAHRGVRGVSAQPTSNEWIQPESGEVLAIGQLPSS